MFCQKCGNEIKEGARFCQECGTPVGKVNVDSPSSIPKVEIGMITKNMTNKELDGKFVYFILAMLDTAFVGIGGLLPVVSFEFWGYGQTLNIFQMISSLNSLEEVVQVSLDGFPRVVLYASMICYIISAFYCVKYVLQFLSGVKGNDLVQLGRVSMSWGETFIILIFLLTWSANASTEEYLYGIQLLALDTNAWLLLIAPLLNLFIFYKGYLGQHIAGIPSREHRMENERIVKDKRCKLCKTTYQIGNQCPKCGSSLVDE